MTSRPQFSLGVTGGNNPLAAAHSAEGGGRFQPQFPSLVRDQIGNLMALEVPPHVFHRIKLRRIGGQPLDSDAAFGGADVVAHQHAAMDRGAIPEDEHFPRHMPLEMLQKFNYLEAFDAAGMNLEVEPPQSQGANDREAFPIEGFLQDGGLPAWGPSAGAGGAGAQSTFVNKDNGAALPAGFFFISGQPTRCHFRMARRLPSMAWRSGRWQLKPLAPSNRQTCPG